MVIWIFQVKRLFRALMPRACLMFGTEVLPAHGHGVSSADKRADSPLEPFRLLCLRPELRAATVSLRVERV